MITGDALRARIEGGLAVYQKPVMVMPMVQGKLQKPGAVGLAFHRIGFLAPIIEVAHQMDLFGLRRDTNEIDRLGHFLRGISIVGKQRMGVMHVLVTLIFFYYTRFAAGGGKSSQNKAQPHLRIKSQWQNFLNCSLAQ